MDKNIIKSILDIIIQFFVKKVDETPQTVVIPQPSQTKPLPIKEVDWNDPESPINKYFTVKKALFLNSWGVSHIPSDSDKVAILEIASGVEKAADYIAQILGRPVQINVHAWMRPEKANCPGTKWDGQDYNKWIYWNQVWTDLTDAQKAEKKVPQSPHRTGHAIDFHIVGFEGVEGCAKIRAILAPKLETLGLRMEDISGGWIHLDNLPVIHLRFFKP